MNSQTYKASSFRRPGIVGLHGWIHASVGWRSRVRKWDFVGNSGLLELCKKYDYHLIAPQSNGWLGNWAPRHTDSLIELIMDQYFHCHVFGHSDGGMMAHLLSEKLVVHSVFAYAAPYPKTIAHGPIALGYNTNDLAKMIDQTALAYEAHCAAGNEPKVIEVAGKHHPTPEATEEYFKWIGDLFTS